VEDAALLLAALALPAVAHTPYLAPASFEVRPDSVVTLDASFAETFFVPEAGSYLALIRYRGPAPAGAAAPMYGNNYTLSFRVLEP
jgi:hypothetical protein